MLAINVHIQFTVWMVFMINPANVSKHYQNIIICYQKTLTIQSLRCNITSYLICLFQWYIVIYDPILITNFIPTLNILWYKLFESTYSVILWCIKHDSLIICVVTDKYPYILALVFENEVCVYFVHVWAKDSLYLDEFQEKKLEPMSQTSPSSEPARLSPTLSDEKPASSPSSSTFHDVIQIISLNKVSSYPFIISPCFVLQSLSTILRFDLFVTTCKFGQRKLMEHTKEENPLTWCLKYAFLLYYLRTWNACICFL